MKIKVIYVIGGNEDITYAVGESYPWGGKDLKVVEIKHIDNSEYTVIFDNGSEVKVFSNNVILYTVPETNE